MVYRDPTPIDPNKDYAIDELAKFIREKMYGRDTREAMAKALEKAGSTAEWAREVAQELIDGSFDEGVLLTEIERKLNELEERYAPELTNIKNEVEDARGSDQTLGDRLDGVNSQLAQTGQEISLINNQLAQKPSRGEITQQDLDKNSINFDGTWFSDEFISDLSNGEINTTYVKDESITTKKMVRGAVKPHILSDYIPGKNILKRSEVEWDMDRVLNSTGGTSASDIYKTTKNFISVLSGEHYVIMSSNTNVVICTYDNETFVEYKVFRPGIGGESFRIPDNANQLKVTVLKSLDEYQLEQGVTFTDYDPGSYQLKGLIINAPTNYENETRDTIEHKIQNTLKDLTPSFYANWKARNKDLTVILIGDSLSTMNNYTTIRSDAMYRPPLMVEYAYPTFLEELIRWEGQEYRRFDVTGEFTESYANSKIAEYDPAWDWEDGASTINKPSLTRVLSGDNVSVSYTIPKVANRCDFIYRTDYLNAESAMISVSKGDGYVEVFDDSDDTWKEANGFTYSAKEENQMFMGVKGNYRKSIYQKRLKMRVGSRNNDGTIDITIQNNGSGRLTYWGIQYSPLDFMLDFLVQARGSHNIPALETFEDWDIDEFEPDLFLFQNPTINEGIGLADENTNEPKTRNESLDLWVGQFVDYLTKIKSKSYEPEVITWTLLFNGTSGSISKTENKVNYGFYEDDKVTIFDLYSKLQYAYEQAGFEYLSVFNFMWEEIKNRATIKNQLWYETIFGDMNKTGKGIMKDNSHYNDNGAYLIYQILKPLFIC